MGLDYSLYNPADFGLTVCFPVLETPEIKYSVQPGCGWLDPGYYRGSRQAHTGIDLNDVRGKNSDLGNRVRAIADGVVVAAGDYPDWSGIVLIYHPQFRVWSQYGHPDNIRVKAGQRVHMGDVIGQIGRMENDAGYAHLHFEIRVSELPPNFWPSTRFYKSGLSNKRVREIASAYIREHYRDPQQWLIEKQALRTLAEVEQVRRSWATPPVVKPRPEAPPAVSVENIPPTPQGVQNPLAPNTLIALFGPDNGPLYTQGGIPVTHIKIQRRTLPGLETQWKAVAVLAKEK